MRETYRQQAAEVGVYASYVKPLASEDLEHVLRHTLPLWDETRGRRIFISGGTGFFGAWLLESLAHCNRRLKLDLEVTVLSRDPEAFTKRMPHLAGDPSIKLLGGDIRDFAFPEQNFDSIIHAAAPTTSNATRRPLELLSVLLGGTEHMLKFARSRAAKRFLFISSGAVYGRQPEHLSHVSENYLGGPDWLDPRSVYGEGKRVSEQLCHLYAREYKFGLAIARCFAFVGPHLPLEQHFAIGNFIGDALAGRDIAIQGDGTPLRSYLYAADLAIWLWTLLFRGAQSGSNPGVFNIGSGQAISICSLAREVVNVLNPSLKVTVAQAPVIGVTPLRYVPDVRAAETSLGLRESVGLREAILRTAAWYQQTDGN